MVERSSVTAVARTQENARGEIAAAAVQQPKRTKYIAAEQAPRGVQQLSERRIVAGPEPPTEQERLLVQLAMAYEDTGPTASTSQIAKRQMIPVSRRPTEEERLLVKVAMTGDANQRAALDPEERQKQQDEMQRQFQAFLNEPTI